MAKPPADPKAELDSSKITTKPWGSGTTTETISYDGQFVGYVFEDRDGKYRWKRGKRSYGPYESRELAIDQAVDEWFREAKRDS